MEETTNEEKELDQKEIDSLIKKFKKSKKNKTPDEKEKKCFFARLFSKK